LCRIACSAGSWRLAAGGCAAKSNCICWVVYCENLRLHWYLSAAPYELFSFHYQNLLFSRIPFPESAVFGDSNYKSLYQISENDKNWCSLRIQASSLIPPLAQTYARTGTCPPRLTDFLNSIFKSLYQISENDKRRRGLRIRASSLILPLAQTCARATTCPRTANPNCISQPASCANLRPHRYPPPHRHLSTRKKAAAPRKKWSSGP